MALVPRPPSHGRIDVNGTNTYPAIDLPEMADGFSDGQIVPAEKWNHPLSRHSAWAAHLDQRALRSGQIAGRTSRLTAASFAYEVGAGLTQDVTDDSAYMIDGYVVDLPVSELVNRGLSPHVFTATKWEHFYVAADGTITSAVVAVGVAAAPPVGTYHLGTGVTDATNVTAWNAGDAAFATHKVISEAAWNIQGTLDADADVNVGGNLAVGGSAVITDTLTVQSGTTLIPSTGTAYTLTRSRAPADATDELTYTIDLHETFAFTAGAGKLVTILPSALLGNASLRILLDVAVTFGRSGSLNTATYQKWFVALGIAGGTTSELDGGAVGEQAQSRVGSLGNVATNVFWSGSALRVVNLNFDASHDGYGTVSGKVSITRYN